jgi:hypothetical protein
LAAEEVIKMEAEEMKGYRLTETPSADVKPPM